MKHLIIVKYNEKVKKEDKENMLKDINELFQHLTEIEGIHEVNVYGNCVDRSNRYDVMIEIVMDREALPVYDESYWHHKWKDDYGQYVLSKAIFDHE